MVFGRISAKTNITKVRIPVAAATPASPAIRIPIMVAIAEAAMFTRLLQIKIKLNKTSVFSSSLLAKIAPLCPCSARCFIL